MNNDTEYFPEAATGEARRNTPRRRRGAEELITRLRAALRGKKYLGLCFLIPAGLLFLIYMCRGVWPNGEGSVLVLDLNGQYVYFFEDLRDIITRGGSFLYTFGRALGGEYMGIYAYYLASPLSYIVALFPKESMTEAIMTLLILKCGLTGLTFGIYVHRKKHPSRVVVLMFSTMWALCSFAVVMQHNVMWTDNIILFPVVLLGIERLIEKGRLSLFVIPLSLCILSNFYIGYMTCIFSGLYFFLYYCSKKKDEINPEGVRFHFLKSFGRFGAASLCAVCIGAVIILPTYYSLTFGKTTFSDPSFKVASKFDLADLLSKFYFGSYDTVRPEGLPFLFTGTLSLLVAPLYFFCRTIPKRQKIVSGITAVLFVACMNVSTLDLVWHGMQKPNWLNYRYAYMFCFFILLWGVSVFKHIRDIDHRAVGLTCAVWVLILVFLQKAGIENLPYVSCVLPSALILIVYVFVLRGVKTGRAMAARAARIALASLVCIEMFASGMVDLEALDKDVVFSKRTGYRNFLDKLSVAVDDIKEYDDSFYRTEKTLMRKSNDNMALGTYGLSGSTSTLNSETITFLNRMGYASKSHWTKYLGGNPVSDSLLGVKYLISGYDDEVYEVRDLFDYPEYSMKSYYNPYALSICTAVSVRLTNASFTDEGIKTPFERLNNLVSNMAGGDGSAVFSEASVSSVSTDNISVSSVAGHTKYAKIGSSPDARVNFRIHVESDDPLYCYFPSEYPRECDLTLNGKSAGTFFGNDTNRIVSLGTFKPGDNIVVTLSLKKDELYIWENESFFWYLDTKAFEKEFSLLTKGNMTVTSHTEDTICGTIDVASDRTQIFTSIPYDREWRVLCDGREVETAEVLDGLLTFSLSPGEHELRLEYRPAPFRNGVIISSLGVVSFILIAAGNRCLIAKCKKKKRRGSDNFN